METEEATLGSVNRPITEAEAAAYQDLTFKTALRHLMQQQGNGATPVEEVRTLTASTSSVNTQRARVNNLNLMMQHQPYSGRSPGKKKVSRSYNKFVHDHSACALRTFEISVRLTCDTLIVRGINLCCFRLQALVAAAGSRQRYPPALHRGPNSGTFKQVKGSSSSVRQQQSAVSGPARSALAFHLTQTHNPNQPISLYSVYPAKKGGIELKIVHQPEEQHRARYVRFHSIPNQPDGFAPSTFKSLENAPQNFYVSRVSIFLSRYLTEGSRGAVKDRSGNAFPTVKVGCVDGHELNSRDKD